MVDSYKVIKANEIYSKMLGIIWTKEKYLKYEDYDICKECKNTLRDLQEELKSLNLTKEEKTMVGFDHVDYNIARRYGYEGFRR